jgi:DNA-binding transcriptional MerR regulator
MTQWFVKDLSKLTGVTVQTLHHYDRIDLLKPSVRLTNGYRVYSETDLRRLQQIIALKFFGFELSQIKSLLAANAQVLEDFAVQAKLLEQKAQHMLEASQTLRGIVSEVSDPKSISWENIIKLIEVYQMTQQLEYPWVKDIFTPEELKQYTAFNAELNAKMTPEQKANFEKRWATLNAEIRKNIDNDPQSAIGIALGGQYMTAINTVYGKKYAHLRTKKYEQGFGEGKGLDEAGLSPEALAWLEQAINAYWRDRVESLFERIGIESDATVLTLWKTLLDELYGEDEARKHDLYALLLSDAQLSPAAKDWLQRLAN